MTSVSRTFTLSVVAASSTVPANTAMLVGTNYETSVMPPKWTAANLEYSLFVSWSGGCLVPGWGTHGAYACSGTGGHAVPENYDAFIFDFADYAWKFVACSNSGLPATTTPLGSMSNGSIAGTTIPAPAHVGFWQAGVGNYIYWPANVFATTSAATGSVLHRYQLNSNLTGTWDTPASNSFLSVAANLFTYGGELNNQLFHDTSRNRLWLAPSVSHVVGSIPYYNLATNTWSGLSLGGNLTADFGGEVMHLYDVAGDRIFLLSSSGLLYSLSLTGSPVGWQSVSVTNAATAMAGISGGFIRWHQYPVADGGDGCLYGYVDNASNQLKRFDPSTRTFSNVTVGGASMPRQNPVNGQIYPLSQINYSRFFYVPARKCFAWIAGNGQQVALLRP
jgi:hypothetical protein